MRVHLDNCLDFHDVYLDDLRKLGELSLYKEYSKLLRIYAYTLLVGLINNRPLAHAFSNTYPLILIEKQAGTWYRYRQCRQNTNKYSIV